jgi:hypothetical protein
VTVSASDLGQTLSGGKFRNGPSRFKGTQTGGVRVQKSTLIFPNEEKSPLDGSIGCSVFPKRSDGGDHVPKREPSYRKTTGVSAEKRLSWRWRLLLNRFGSLNRSAPIPSCVVWGRSQTGSSHWASGLLSETVIQPDLRGDGGELPGRVEGRPFTPDCPDDRRAPIPGVRGTAMEPLRSDPNPTYTHPARNWSPIGPSLRLRRRDERAISPPAKASEQQILLGS